VNFPTAVIGIQCRISSSRLPCKALLQLADTTILGMCIERSRNVGYPVFLLTSDHVEDNLIAESALKSGVDGVIRGSLDNVLSRYVSLAERVSCDYLVRVTADNPLTEYGFIPHLIHHVSTQKLPYSCIKPSLCPEGTNVEVFSRQAVFESAILDKSQSNLEHVTPYMKRDLLSSQFLVDIVSGFFPFDCEQLSFTVDKLCDYVRLAGLVNSVVQNMDIAWRSPEFVRACAEFASNHSCLYAKGRNHFIE